MDSSIVQEVRSLLLLRDNGTLIDLCEEDRRFWKALRLNLNEGDDVLRHRAIEAVAGLMQRWWQSGRQDSVRDYMRRLIWSMTDESGEIGWSAPETMAEIIVHIPELLEPYGSIMIARAFEEPPLVKGGLWGIGRLGKRIGQVIELHQNEILAAFDSDDPEIIGLAAWSMGEVGFVPALPHLKSLQSWKGSAKLFIADDFVEKPLEDWVKEAIYRIETGPTAASR